MSKVNFIKVERNSFNDEKTGREVSYCKFSVLIPTPTTSDSVGYDCETFTTRYDNYDTIKRYVESDKAVDVKLDFVKQKDGLYKAKVIQIEGMSLV